MSGGSLNYSEWRITELADKIREQTRLPLHVAFAKHLDKCAKAVHALEWVLSSDTSPGDEKEAIMAVIKPQDVLIMAQEEAARVLEELRTAIDEVKSE
jgi:hypothetical protein